MKTIMLAYILLWDCGTKYKTIWTETKLKKIHCNRSFISTWCREQSILGTWCITEPSIVELLTWTFHAWITSTILIDLLDRWRGVPSFVTNVSKYSLARDKNSFLSVQFKASKGALDPLARGLRPFIISNSLSIIYEDILYREQSTLYCNEFQSFIALKFLKVCIRICTKLCIYKEYALSLYDNICMLNLESVRII